MIEAIALSRLLRAAGGELVGPDVAISGIAIDSRNVAPGDLFVAIPGAHVDGHDYIAEAAVKGAAAVLAQRRPEESIGLPTLLVPDTVRALGALGGLIRDDYDGVAVGITGSAGKTTAKEMMAAVLAHAGATVATTGNRNNEIGLPLTLAQLQANTEFAVVEMGAAKPNDIRYLCDIARPNVSVLLNVGTAHLAAYPDVAGIADTKAQILDGLDADDLAVINADHAWALDWQSRAVSGRVVTFGTAGAATYRATDIVGDGFYGVGFTVNARGRTRRVTSKVPGAPGVYNALATIAVASELGLSDGAIDRGLAEVDPGRGRGRVLTVAGGATVVDHSYNASPEALKAAIDTLVDMPGRHTLIMGSMLELGSVSPTLHQQVATHAAQSGVERLIAVGDEAHAAAEAFGSNARYYPNTDALLAAEVQFSADDIVLVKGSRAVGLDVWVNAVSTRPESVAC